MPPIDPNDPFDSSGSSFHWASSHRYPCASRCAATLAGLPAGTGSVDWTIAGLFYLTAYGLGTALTAFTLILEDLSFHRYETFRDRALLFWWALVENLGYRQMTVYWRLRGLWKFLRGNKDWGSMERKGFRPVTAS